MFLFCSSSSLFFYCCSLFFLFFYFFFFFFIVLLCFFFIYFFLLSFSYKISLSFPFLFTSCSLCLSYLVKVMKFSSFFIFSLPIFGSSSFSTSFCFYFFLFFHFPSSYFYSFMIIIPFLLSSLPCILFFSLGASSSPCFDKSINLSTLIPS